MTDAKAPAAVKALSAKVAGHTVTLTWKNPADKDFDHVEITASERKPAARKAAKRVYSGKGTKATTTLGAGQSRWFTVVAYDRVGNASAPATVHVTIAAASPFGPAPRATVHGKVQLHWPVVKGAKYYNVQLYAGKKRILVSWPAGHAVQLPKTKLKRGTKYTWYVWPASGKGQGALRQADRKERLHLRRVSVTPRRPPEQVVFGGVRWVRAPDSSDSRGTVAAAADAVQVAVRIGGIQAWVDAPLSWHSLRSHWRRSCPCPRRRPCRRRNVRRRRVRKHRDATWTPSADPLDSDRPGGRP